ncbi:GNAT family N-acetyltransferase [Chryseolinea lacunae]|uniref:GNAT family N-acetyltransferase n=1 Tax=Chryseolinea lacunae TaxID=2801331 RepID=A0ABS1KXW8_9BACT|nr:GNAT family N-acetyltransferase [Chryseolinea lacunae]MBL0743166.1 GNAT family N-acetyltransferase [Chryseolinea lacunae]
MIIRQAIASDAAAIGTLLAQLGYPPPESNPEFVKEKIEYYSRPFFQLLVAEENQGVSGFISLHWFEVFHSPGMLARITAFCVNEQLRSTGIGHHLLETSYKFLSEQGCHAVEVTSNMRRSRTHEFYLKKGFLETSRRFIKSLTPPA